MSERPKRQGRKRRQRVICDSGMKLWCIDLERDEDAVLASYQGREGSEAGSLAEGSEAEPVLDARELIRGQGGADILLTR